jgi:hypothetical protein
MNGTCYSHRRKEKFAQNFGRNPKEKKPPGRPGEDGRVLLKWILRKNFGSVNWIHKARNGDLRQALLNITMSLWVP